ncbi:MAG: DUF4390 domain-containing protein [Deltaproteobacteria bacterium]|nr:DUF4390 domain-containing protein [Deltaproteobacteria bacterium]
MGHQRYFKKTVLIISIIFALVICPIIIHAEDARLSDFVVTNNRDHLLLYFSVENCFKPELSRAIESGLETTFTFFVRLYERQEWWWDKNLRSIEIRHSIKYDHLKNIYKVKLSEQENKVISVKGFDEAKKLMSDVVSLKVIPLHYLKKGQRYQIQMMANMDRVNLPFYLHYVFFFVSFWDFETDWHTIDFRY